MKTDYKNGIKWVTIDPGEYYVTANQIVITTLLGSCISACLFDPVNHVSGMNHFLLSERRHTELQSIWMSDAGRYGIHAMELIINKMLKLGAQKKYLKAKVFGGANVLQSANLNFSTFNVGEINIQFIEKFLSNENIPIISSDLGSDFGRVIRFDTNSFTVYMRKIKKAVVPLIEKRDKNYFDRSIRERKRTILSDNNIDLWQ